MALKIYQTYSGAAQRSYLAPGSIPYDYSSNAGTEYEIFKAIHAQAKPSGPWGVLSWKFDVKCHISLQAFEAAARLHFEQGADCVFINPMIGAEAVFANVWEQGIACGHEGLEKMIPFLADRLYLRPQDLFMPRIVFAFCNYFIATDRFWSRYFDFVDSVLTDLDLEAQRGAAVGLIAQGPSNYSKNPKLSMQPFVVERLFSTFIPQSGLDVRSIDLDLPVYKAKFGALLGNTLHQLSTLKNQTQHDPALSRTRWEQLARQLIAGRSFLTLMHLDDPDLAIADVGLAAA